MRPLFQLFALAFLLAVPMAANATTALFVTEVEQAELSNAVAVVTVVSQEVTRHPTFGRPQTLSTLRIEERLMGELPETIVLNQLGGELDGRLHYIPGDARLAVGERCLLYLRQVEGLWYLTAMEQSKYTLTPSIDGDILSRDLSGGLVTRDALGALVDWHGEDEMAPTTTDLKWLLADPGLRREMRQ